MSSGAFVITTMPLNRARAVTGEWAVAAVCCFVSIVALYPGQYSFDSAYQLWQARSGQLNDLSPVAMTALWSVLLDTTGNPAALFCLNLAMFWSGLVLCVVAITRKPLVRAALLLVFGLGPVALAQMAHLLTDAHLAAVLVLATGLLTRGLTTKRRLPLIACVLMLLYAGCVRHNALIAIVPCGALIALSFAPRGANRLFVGLSGALALGVASFAAGFVLDRALVIDRKTVWPTIALWDLAAISVDRDQLLLPAFTHGPGMTADELRDTGAFNPTTNTLLFQKSRSGMRDGLGEPYTAAQLHELAGAWINAVRQNPGAYLRHRIRTFWLLIGPHQGDVQGIAYFVGRTRYGDDPPFPAPAAPALQRHFYTMVAAMQPTWIFAALPYLLLDIAALVLGWLHRDRLTARIGLAVAAGALLYAAGFFPLAPDANLRYLTWPIVAAPLALAFAI